MRQHEDWTRRLEDKDARKSLEEIYGREAGGQAERYSGLAELLLGELDPEGGPKGAPKGDPEGGVEGALRFYSAPGRTELGGNHTDHNHGRVLCAAVGLDALACVAPREDRLVRLVSEGYPDPIVVDLSSLERKPSEAGTTASLIRGVAAGIVRKAGPEAAAKLRGFTGRMTSRVLPGSGLSSSAAVEVLIGTILSDLAGFDLKPVEIAKIGPYAENEYFGKPCGLMDQTASAVGGIVAIDFAAPASPEVKRIKYDFAEEGYDLVVVNTGGSHADLTPDYAAVPAEMKAVAAVLGAGCLREIDPLQLTVRGPEIRKACGDRALLRALHFAAENERVLSMAEALEADDLGAYLKLVKRSGRSSWELLQNLYSPARPAEQGLSLALALSAEYLGRKGAWRVHGGGFAGTIQAYLPKKLSAGYSGLMERYFGAGSVIPVAVRARGAVRVRV